MVDICHVSDDSKEALAQELQHMKTVLKRLNVPGVHSSEEVEKPETKDKLGGSA